MATVRLLPLQVSCYRAVRLGRSVPSYLRTLPRGNRAVAMAVSLHYKAVLHQYRTPYASARATVGVLGSRAHGESVCALCDATSTLQRIKLRLYALAYVTMT